VHEPPKHQPPDQGQGIHSPAHGAGCRKYIVIKMTKYLLRAPPIFLKIENG